MPTASKSANRKGRGIIFICGSYSSDRNSSRCCSCVSTWSIIKRIKPRCSAMRRYFIIIIIALQSFCWAYAVFSVSLSYTHSVGPLGQGISSSQSFYLHTEQHKHRIKAHSADIHDFNGIRTHDPSVRVSEDSSCPRPRVTVIGDLS
jgi:hypothetical protein